MKIWKTLVLSSMLALSGCDDLGKVIDDPEYEYRSGTRLVLRVHLFDNLADLNEAYKQLQPNGERMLGFAVTQRNIATLEPNFCDIFVLKTPYANDQQLATWGHELKHCLEGDFHLKAIDR